jgi:hypothetical protein
MKRSLPALALLGLVSCLAFATSAQAQRRPYIGYAYPAGAQQGTTVQLRLGGQDMDDVTGVVISGTGVTTKIVEYRRRLNNQEVQLLNEQLKELKRAPSTAAPAMASMMNAENSTMMSTMGASAAPAGPAKNEAAKALIERLEQRTRVWVQQPACASISSITLIDVTVAPEAEIGARELRLVTARGVSNPLVFHVGQLAEYTRKPMTTAILQTLGKEAAALRKRPVAEAEDRIILPATVNGQIASGEINRYRFTAAKGQRLVISTLGRQLIPYVADAVPGWFQPVLALYDAKGKELAFADDYRFKPDPVILFQVPEDGDYVFAIYDSIYRGREDFVYRITVGELPFATSVFPLGGQIGKALPPDLSGWNLQAADLATRPQSGKPGVQSLAASRMGYDSNRLPFAWDTLPDALDKESNNTIATAQNINLPVVINGRINRTDDWDVYQFSGKANQTIVIDVQARRLDSPLDSVVKLTDAKGKVIAFNDDREDLTAGVNTHPADSYLTAKLPTDGAYFVHIGDTARNGGDEYGYRLRVSAPQPDFELRVVPSSISLAINSTATVSVYAVRKDGFSGPIKLTLDNPPTGFSAAPITLPANQTIARLTFKSGATPTSNSVALSVVGSAKIAEQEIAHQAVPAEDRMQAFLWRHLVPANDLQALVFDPRVQPKPSRVARIKIPAAPGAPTVAAPAPTAAPAKPKFTKQQIVGRLRQLKLLYEEGLLTDDFYDERVAECETPS